MKKIFIILIILALAALGVWFFLGGEVGPQVETILSGSPFGSGEDAETAGDPSTPLGASGQSVTDEFISPTSNLLRISETPVAGAVSFTHNNQTIIRYVDRATGHIYDFNPATLTKTKVTNQTLPKIYEAHFRPDGNAVLLRSLKNDSDAVENLSLVLTPPQATTSSALYTTSSTLLRGDITSVSVGAGNALFYALRDTASVVTSAFNGSGLRTLLNSPFTNWRLAAAGNRLFIQPKASAGVPGYAYTISTSGGSLVKILGPLNGLIAVPGSDGNRVLYSYVEDGETKLFSKNLVSGSVSEILPATLAEKCAWSARDRAIVICGEPIEGVGEREPDGWYRGTTHFSDRIWQFDTDNQVAELLSEPKTDIKTDIDVYQPKLSPNEDYFIFTNRNDLSLWILKLD